MKAGTTTVIAGLVVSGAAAIALIASPAMAAPRLAVAAGTGTVGVTLNGSGGCQGGGTSIDGKGTTLDSATAPGGGGASASHPLVVERGGTVRWHGSTATVITNHHWWVHLDGFPVKSGGSANNSHATTKSGVEKAGKYLPSWLGLTGTFYVNGEISGTGGKCTGALYVKLNGDPAAGALFWVGIGFVLLSGLTLFSAVWARSLTRRPIRGLLGGLLLGLGLIILLILVGAAAFTSWAPFAGILGACIAVGGVLGAFSPQIRPSKQ
ncbi:MAG TPA: hypothetical protein VKR22_13160 [Acidimicrobiales bacterium]|nr:hypothetical protein [Acidimicrobiales bacterium]